MQAGKHFPDLFTDDNFTSRRTTGNNMYNPESLFSGGEWDNGFCGPREWASHQDYLDAVHGRISPDDILHIAPRTVKTDHVIDTIARLELIKLRTFDHDAETFKLRSDIDAKLQELYEARSSGLR